MSRERYWLLWSMLFLLSLLMIRSGMRPYPTLSEQVGAVSYRGGYRDLANQVNPNEASWASLARLPGIGRGKAQAIVRYRQDYRNRHDSAVIVFRRAEDLAHVRGIGAVTVERMKAYLAFHNKDQSGSVTPSDR